MKILLSSSSLGILLFLCFVNPKQFVDLLLCRASIETKLEEKTDTNIEIKEEENLAENGGNNLIDTQENQNTEINVEELNELKSQIKELKEKEVDSKEKFDKMQIYVEELREKLEENERIKRNKWYHKPSFRKPSFRKPFGRSQNTDQGTDNESNEQITEAVPSESSPEVVENSNERN